jgi:hypothetical protein
VIARKRGQAQERQAHEAHEVHEVQDIHEAIAAHGQICLCQDAEAFEASLSTHGRAHTHCASEDQRCTEAAAAAVRKQIQHVQLRMIAGEEACDEYVFLSAHVEFSAETCVGSFLEHKCVLHRGIEGFDLRTLSRNQSHTLSKLLCGSK